MSNVANLSAYQGKGWRARTSSLESEIKKRNGTWSSMRVDSEYKTLKDVLLYCPGREMADVKHPNAVQHIARIRPDKIIAEFRRIMAVYRSLNIAVHYMQPNDLQLDDRLDKYNIMYARDLFLNTREGAIVARMGSTVRAGEEKFAALALAKLTVPINKTITSTGLLEGADVLWLDPKTVICGLGDRTNRDGFLQVRAVLKQQGVETLTTRLPAGIQHLLGILQIIDKRLALVRTDIAPKRLLNILRKKKFSIIKVAETEEVQVRQGMNVVTIKPRIIIMPAHCPGLKRLYLASGITVAAEIEIGQLLNGGGGLACATGILAREI